MRQTCATALTCENRGCNGRAQYSPGPAAHQGAVTRRSGSSVTAASAQSPRYGAAMDGATVEVELHGGPLDDWVVPVDRDDPDPWTAIISEYGRYPGGRSLYSPDTGGAWRGVRDLRPDGM